MASIIQALPDVPEWVRFQVKDLPPRAINWLVAVIENPLWMDESYMDGSSSDLEQDDDNEPFFAPVSNQRQLGAIIDRELIGTIPGVGSSWIGTIRAKHITISHQGGTRAQAALRCHIHKHLGDSVQVPKVWAI